MRTLYLCGAGNSEGVRLALTVNRVEKRWQQVVLLDDDASRHGQALLGVEIAGPLERLAEADPEQDEVASFVARTTNRRAAVRAKLEGYGIPFARLIHPNVDIWGAELARDVIVYEYATISPEVVLGESSCVFMGAVVGHESRVGRCCVCAAGSVLNARVVLEDGVYVGTNASVLPEVRIGAGSTVGANTVVIADAPEGSTIVGVPGGVLRSAGARPAVGTEGAAESCGLSAELDAELVDGIHHLWAELLHREAFANSDNFFDLGGTSLLALQLTQRLREAFDCALSITDVFQFPTVDALAHHLCVDRVGAGASASSRASRRARARRQKRTAG